MPVGLRRGQAAKGLKLWKLGSTDNQSGEIPLPPARQKTGIQKSWSVNKCKITYTWGAAFRKAFRERETLLLGSLSTTRLAATKEPTTEATTSTNGLEEPPLMLLASRAVLVLSRSCLLFNVPRGTVSGATRSRTYPTPGVGE